MSRAPYISLAVFSKDAGRRFTSADIVQSIMTELNSGRIPAGSRLPPVRVLERQLGISKNTVQAAYDELARRGLLESRERDGVFVAERLWSQVVDSATLGQRPPLPQMREPPPMAEAAPPGFVSLSAVFIDPELLPRAKLADCTRSILKSPKLSAFYDAQGLPSLREVIAARLRTRGMPDVQASNVLVTTGSQQAIDLVARTLEKRVVALENPVYAYAKFAFATHGHAITGLRLDPFRGIDLDQWDQEFARTSPTLFYGITSYQNPTGYSYSTSELVRLLEMSQRHRFAILEDDWGSDMLSGSEYRPSLRMLGGDSVIYVNSFTKKLLPSLRVGFLVAHDSIMPSLIAAKRISTLGNPWITEAIVAEFLDRGYYDTYLAQIHDELDARYAACLEALREMMPPSVRFTTPGGGPTLWLDLPSSISLDDLEARLREHRISIETASVGFSDTPHLHGFRLGYAYLPPDVLRKSLATVASELRALGA